MRLERTWNPYLAALQSVKSATPTNPKLEALNDKVVAAWKRFSEAGERKGTALPSPGADLEEINSGQMLSFPFSLSSDDLGIRLVKLRPSNRVAAIRLDKGSLEFSQVMLFVVQFIMGSLWTTRSNQTLDWRKVSPDEQSLKATRENLAARLDLLVKRLRKVVENQGNSEKGISYTEIVAPPAAQDIPWDSLEVMESQSVYQGSFLGLMLPARDQKDGQLLHPQRIYLCVNGQAECAKSRRLKSLDELDALLRAFGTSDDDTFLSNAMFAQEVLLETSWKALEIEAREQLEKLGKEYSRLPRRPNK